MLSVSSVSSLQHVVLVCNQLVDLVSHVPTSQPVIETPEICNMFYRNSRGAPTHRIIIYGERCMLFAHCCPIACLYTRAAVSRYCCCAGHNTHGQLHFQHPRRFHSFLHFPQVFSCQPAAVWCYALCFPFRVAFHRNRWHFSCGCTKPATTSVSAAKACTNRATAHSCCPRTAAGPNGESGAHRNNFTVCMGHSLHAPCRSILK